MTHITHRSLRNQRARLAAAVEPLERRLLLTAVVVNATADVTDAPGSTVVSLRDAVTIANKSTAPTTITFDPKVFATLRTIALNGHDLELSGKQPITITGPAAGVTVNGKNSSADFVIDKGATATISGLTITGGNNASGNGGGVENNGALTLKGVSVTRNVSGTSGGGIENNGALAIANSTVSNNSGGYSWNGGGIDNFGTLAITNSTVSNNSAGFDGSAGGIENESGGVMTLTNATLSGNSGAASGGIENYGTATLTAVTVSSNQAVGGGGPGGVGPGRDGGIGNYGKMTLTDCTVTGNSDGTTGGGIGNHGAMTLADSTVSGNTAGGGVYITFDNPPPVYAVGAGGGLYIDPASSSTVIQNSIIAGNQVTNGTGPDVSGAVHSSGYDLIGQTNGSTGWKPTDRTGTTAHPLNALLSPLGPFGGLTQTLVPMAGSPAIDRGSNALIPAGITTDQRGLQRITNHTVDIGAVEVQPSQAHIVVTARAGLTATEDLAYSLSPGSFTETGAAGPYTADMNWGDGTPDSVFQVASPGALPRVSHTFAEEGSYRGVVTVFDGTGHNSAPTAFGVKVADASLSGSAAPLSGVAAGVPLAWQVAAFSDLNPNASSSDFSAKINWGDGTTSTGVVASENLGLDQGPFGVTGTHTYASAGTYKFTVTVADAGGATLTVSSTITCLSSKSIVVNTTQDQTDPAGSAVVSLRDAVVLANKSSVPTAISFDPKVFATAKTIALTGSSLQLSRQTTISIVGPSAGVTIGGNNQSDVFDIGAGVRASFSGLTIAQGYTGISNQGVLFLTNCTVLGDSSSTLVDIYNSGGFMVLTGVTVSGNQNSQGAGIQNQSGKMTLIDCTVADNSNGISNQSEGILTLLDSTISGNGTGLSNGPATVMAANSIIAGNSATDVSGAIDSLGFNLVGQTDGSTGWLSTDLTGSTAKPLSSKLLPLSKNGGPTLTLYPMPGSPATNHGSNALVPLGLTTDQRGKPRIAGGTVDIGAVEVQ